MPFISIYVGFVKFIDIIFTEVKYCCLGDDMQKNKGFTLIELMVTIAVLAIIAMIAAPSMTSNRYDQELKEQERKISLTLSDARSNAKALNRPMHVYFTSPNSSTDPSNTFYADIDTTKFDFTGVNSSILFKNNGIINLPTGTSSICLGIKHKKSGKLKSIKLNRFGMQESKNSACGG